MDPEERLERLHQALTDLQTANEQSAVVVEGLRDERALRELGLHGEILVYNQGRSMPAFTDQVRTRDTLIVLFDWDRKGGQLTRLLQQQFGGGPHLDLDLRKELARVSLVKCVEDLPAALRTLTRRATERKAEEWGP